MFLFFFVTVSSYNKAMDRSQNRVALHPENSPATRSLFVYYPCLCGGEITAVPVRLNSGGQEERNRDRTIVDEALRRYVQDNRGHQWNHPSQQTIPQPAERVVYPEYSDSDELPQAAHRRKKIARRNKKLYKSEALDAERWN